MLRFSRSPYHNLANKHFISAFFTQLMECIQTGLPGLGVVLRAVMPGLSIAIVHAPIRGLQTEGHSA